MSRTGARMAGATVVGVAALVAASGPAWAQTEESFYPAAVPIVFTATADGSATSFDIDASPDLLAPGQAPSQLPVLGAGETYFEVTLQPDESDATTIPVTLPLSAGSLVTANGAVAPAGFAAPYDEIGTNWYFPVADSITQATLHITSSTVTAANNDGTSTNYVIGPASIEFITATPAPLPTVPAPSVTAPPSTTAPPLTTVPSTTTDPKVQTRPATGVRLHLGPRGHSAGTAIVIGTGGLALLGAGGALLTSRRRRAFYKADREGRVVLVGPLTTKPTIGSGAPTLEPRHWIVVKILGWLEIIRAEHPFSGTEQRIAVSGPVSEIIVFLVLNPGRSFTSVQLREAIWCLGRSPITPATFRKYMVELRKAFGPGVVVTDRYRYELTGTVTSDLAAFHAALEGTDPITGPEEGLALVRGPVLHGSFDGKKNSPFAWAVDTADRIEDEVTAVAYDLVLACLAASDPARAAVALAHGLLCSATNLRLRLVELEVGLTLGGTQELTRRLAAGRAAMAGFPDDLKLLEQTAQRLEAEVLST